MYRAGTREDRLAALADLVDRHYASLFAYLDCLTGDRALAHDLAQESFLRAFDSGRHPGRPQAARVWLYRVATGLALTILSAGSAEGVPGRAALAAARWTGGKETADLQQMLAGLPRLHAALVLLCRHFGFSLADAASVLKVRDGVASRLLSQAYAEYYRCSEQPLSEQGHASVWPALSRYGELRPAARARVDAHLEACRPCAARLAAYTRLTRDLARLTEPWPIPRARELLAAAFRHDDVGGLRRTGPPESERAPNRLMLLAAGAALGLTLVLWAFTGGRLLSPAGQAPDPAGPAPATATAAPSILTPSTPAALSDTADSPSLATLAWLGEHTFPLTTTEPSGWYGDLIPLNGLLARAHVVVVDDAAGFGSHESQAFRQRLLEMLVGESGFDTLLLPLDWADADLFNQYVQGAELDPLKLLASARLNSGQAGGLWQSQETLYSLRWLRAHNAQAGAEAPVAIRGFLPLTSPSRVPLDVILAYLEDVDSPSVGRVEKEFASDHRALLAYLQAREGKYVPRSSEALYRRALSAAKALVQYDTIASATSAGQRDLLIDAASVLNVMADWGQLGPRGKEVIWTPGLSSPGFTNLGNLLQAERRGGAALILGLAFQRGAIYLPENAGDATGAATETANAGVGVTRGGLRRVTIPAAPPGSYEDYLAHAPHPNFFLNLRSAFGAAEETSWLREAHVSRSASGNVAGCATGYESVRLSTLYDIIVYFSRVTPPSLLAQREPPQAAPAPACPPAP